MMGIGLVAAGAHGLGALGGSFGILTVLAGSAVAWTGSGPRRAGSEGPGAARSGDSAARMEHAMVPGMKEPEVVEEAALIAGLKLGNDAAFETLVRSQSARMLCVARHFLGDTEEARDAVQEAFVSAFKAIERFEGGSRLSTWLHQITVNACLMRLRSRRRKPEEPIEDLLPTYLADGHHAVPPSEWSMRADELVHREETRAFVRECIERLPDSYRSVLLLRDIEELDTAEVAGLLGISENAVKTRLHRARQALRTLLSSRYGKASS